MVGIKAVIAESFARIFYRNAINIGLPAVVLDTALISEGDILDLDLAGGRVLDLTTNKDLQLPENVQDDGKRS